MSDGVAGFERDMVSIAAGDDAVIDFKEELVQKIQEKIKELQPHKTQKSMRDFVKFRIAINAEISGLEWVLKLLEEKT